MPEIITGNYRLLKDINSNVILNLVRTNAPISGAVLAKITGMRPSTVHNILKNLEKEKLVLKIGTGDSTKLGGRRPTLWKIRGNYGYIIGIQIAITEIEVVLVNLNSRIIDSQRLLIEQFNSLSEIDNKIVEILESIPIKSFFALHDNTKKKLIKFGLYDRLKKNKLIKLIKPMEYTKFIYQLSQCDLIVCDGGSMQEESLIFNKPCIILRTATERQEGLETNFQFLSCFNTEETKEKIIKYLNPSFKMERGTNPYGENVSKKIVDILEGGK